MKQLFVLLFIYVFLITNSCSHNKIRLGRKHDHKRTEQVSNEQNTPSIEEQIQSEDVELTLAPEPEELEEKKTLEERAIDQVDKVLDEESSETFHAIIEKSKSKKLLKTNPDGASDQEEKTRNATLLIIFGLVLLTVGIGLMLLAIYTLETSDGSAEGCFETILLSILLVIMAIVIGVGGIVLFVLGMVTAFRR